MVIGLLCGLLNMYICKDMCFFELAFPMCKYHQDCVFSFVLFNANASISVWLLRDLSFFLWVFLFNLLWFAKDVMCFHWFVLQGVFWTIYIIELDFLVYDSHRNLLIPSCLLRIEFMFGCCLEFKGQNFSNLLWFAKEVMCWLICVLRCFRIVSH